MSHRIDAIHRGEAAILIGTGPSLTAQLAAVRESDAIRFGVNNTYRDVELDYHTAIDPDWWRLYGDDFRERCPDVNSFFYQPELCERFGLRLITIDKNRDKPGLSTDPAVVHRGHSSTYMALNILLLLGCDPIYLVGFDMDYPAGQPRHYFRGLSNEDGEYPDNLRKFSPFYRGKSLGMPIGGLCSRFETVAQQCHADHPNWDTLNAGMPRIINCTRDSAMICFPFGDVDDKTC